VELICSALAVTTVSFKFDTLALRISLFILVVLSSLDISILVINGLVCDGKGGDSFEESGK